MYTLQIIAKAISKKELINNIITLLNEHSDSEMFEIDLKSNTGFEARLDLECESIFDLRQQKS